ncbi:MAG: type II toxin-antitoxin system mRNA interferase toxin, RelE/StbE family [Deinococcales bacterium]
MFEVVITSKAQKDLASITNQRTKKAIASRLIDLKTEPEKRGKPLTGDLKGFYSIRAASQRYRIIYEVTISEGMVSVVVIGIRKEGDKKDAYEVARKRLGKQGK